MSERIFTEPGDFDAYHAAEKWLREYGYSIGFMQAHAPTGVMHGDCLINKWRNLSSKERKMMHGQITGDFRAGPVTVRVVGGPLA